MKPGGTAYLAMMFRRGHGLMATLATRTTS